MLKGRQSFAAEFSSVDTVFPAHIIVETYSRECIVYFGTLRQTVADPIHRAASFVVVEFSKVGTA